jgi:hypothetical protein
MEIVILMAWSIWKCRNEWIFENRPPSIQRCRSFLSEELKWLLLRANQSLANSLSSWMLLMSL